MGLELRAACLWAVGPWAFLPAVAGSSGPWFLRLVPPVNSWPHLSHTLDLPDPGLKARAFTLALAFDATDGPPGPSLPSPEPSFQQPGLLGSFQVGPGSSHFLVPRQDY